MITTHDGDKAGSVLVVESAVDKEKLARNAPQTQNALLLILNDANIQWDDRIHQLLNKVGLGFLAKNSTFFAKHHWLRWAFLSALVFCVFAGIFLQMAQMDWVFFLLIFNILGYGFCFIFYDKVFDLPRALTDVYGWTLRLNQFTAKMTKNRYLKTIDVDLTYDAITHLDGTGIQVFRR